MLALIALAVVSTCPPAQAAAPTQHARARSALASYASRDDYPPMALRNREQGQVAFALAVGTDGRVSDCHITESSGSPALDMTTCRLMRSRARFTPARDSAGNAVPDTAAGEIGWHLPAQ